MAKFFSSDNKNTVMDVISTTVNNIQQDCDTGNETYSYDVMEPRDEATSDHLHRFMSKTMLEFQDHLVRRSQHFLGYPSNMNYKYMMILSPLLQLTINNVGDPFVESTVGLHSKKFEIGILNWFARLWGIDKDEYWGYVTNGGTEGNFQGILQGRELLPDGILYTSQESHYSIFKAVKMYRMECKVISALSTGEVDYKELRDNLILNKDKPAIINVNIGTIFKGGVDNIDLIVKVLEECGFSEGRFYIHCDVALYGLVSPFLDQDSKFNFKKPIGSVAVSGHKLLGCPMPCGVYMTRKEYASPLFQNIDYIRCVDSTISGSRNGHNPIFMWYTLSLKGYKGLRYDVRMCLRNAQYLRDRLKDIEISTMLNDMGIVVVFECPFDQCFAEHWSLSHRGKMAHVVVLPHVSTRMLDDFVIDLVRKRKSWYGHNNLEPPCVAEEIGIQNCVCLDHQ
ncbi:serine decarboxylase-like [Andrographis paniculata]|uniref:serine decarboxylase-like n=1 Tax=Andrographis paniculata TaxID=175694 RepID=UPI0021E86DF1|nr:serine decarboxylase-like [Andrographis paniculata]